MLNPFTIERWKSNQKGREDHYYLDKERKIYLFGANTDLLSRATLKQILDIVLAHTKDKIEGQNSGKAV